MNRSYLCQFLCEMKQNRLLRANCLHPLSVHPIYLVMLLLIYMCFWCFNSCSERQFLGSYLDSNKNEIFVMHECLIHSYQSLLEFHQETKSLDSFQHSGFPLGHRPARWRYLTQWWYQQWEPHSWLIPPASSTLHPPCCLSHWTLTFWCWIRFIVN